MSVFDSLLAGALVGVSPAILRARLEGSRAAYVALMCDGDALGQPWAPSRSSVMVTPAGALVWDSTPLPDALAVAQ